MFYCLKESDFNMWTLEKRAQWEEKYPSDLLYPERKGTIARTIMKDWRSVIIWGNILLCPSLSNILENNKRRQGILKDMTII